MFLKICSFVRSCQKQSDHPVPVLIFVKQRFSSFLNQCQVILSVPLEKRGEHIIDLHVFYRLYLKVCNCRLSLSERQLVKNHDLWLYQHFTSPPSRCLAERTTTLTQLTCFSTSSPMAWLIFRYSVRGPFRMRSNASIAWDKSLHTQGQTRSVTQTIFWAGFGSLCSSFHFWTETCLHRRRSRSLRSPSRWTPAWWRITSPGASQLAPSAPSNLPCLRT